MSWICTFRSRHVGAAGCWHVDAVAGCSWRVLLSEYCVRYEAWARVLVSLQKVAARCLWQCGRWALICHRKINILLSGFYAGVIVWDFPLDYKPSSHWGTIFVGKPPFFCSRHLSFGSLRLQGLQGRLQQVGLTNRDAQGGRWAWWNAV